MSELDRSRPVRGASLIAVAAFGFTCMHVCVRMLGETIHPFEIAFFRSFFGLLVILPSFARHGVGILATAHLGKHFARGSFQTLAMMCFFLALTLTPLAKASALSFTAPLFAAAGAVVVLREPLHARRIVALVTGLLGALVVLRPGLIALDRGALLALASSAMWAVCLVLIKRISATDSSITQTAYMGLFMAPLLAVPTAFVWRTPAGVEWIWLLVLGVVGAGSQFLMAEGLRSADASAVLPADYSRLLWATLFGLTLFGELPDFLTYVGGLMILGATALLALAEARSSRRRAAPNVSA